MNDQKPENEIPNLENKCPTCTKASQFMQQVGPNLMANHPLWCCSDKQSVNFGHWLSFECSCSEYELDQVKLDGFKNPPKIIKVPVGVAKRLKLKR